MESKSFEGPPHLTSDAPPERGHVPALRAPLVVRMRQEIRRRGNVEFFSSMREGCGENGTPSNYGLWRQSRPTITQPCFPCCRDVGQGDIAHDGTEFVGAGDVERVRDHR